jgi:nicotinate-nucleotide adenylyltransferase
LSLNTARIGIYGGSFNPIHLGHLSLAVEMLEIHRLDAVWLCPAHANPHRQGEALADASHRCAMIQDAIRGIPGLQLITTELNRPSPSYTVDTLRYLKAHAQHGKHVQTFFWIMGADSAATFCYWHEPEEIIKLATPLVGQRANTVDQPWYLTDSGPVAAALRAGITPTRSFDVSSSEIRIRVRNHKRVEHLLPSSVWRYIQNHQLYL